MNPVSLDDLSLDDPRFDILNGGHSVFSPSGSAMWLWCLGSLIPNILAPDDAGEEAAEGSVAHGVAEEWLKTGRRPKHLIGTVQHCDGFDIEITETMLAYVEEYVDWCNDQPGEHYTETKVWFSDLTPIPKQGGTSDHAAIDGDTITITDLKYGKGVMVFAAEDLQCDEWCYREAGEVVKINGNTQAMLYAYGYWKGLPEVERNKITRVVVRICQPRLGHFQVWETTIHELLDFAAWVKARAALAWRPNAPRRASEKACKWCKVKKGCPALAEWLLEAGNRAADDVFEDMTVEPWEMEHVMERIDHNRYDPKLLRPLELSTEQMAKLLRMRKVIESWFSEMDEELNRRANAGQPIPGMKLVDGRVNRVFKNKRDAERFLHAQGVDTLELYTLKFASPAQAEELLVAKGLKLREAKQLLAAHVEKPAPKRTLVPLSDPRERYDAVADEVFSDTTADDL